MESFKNNGDLKNIVEFLNSGFQSKAYRPAQSENELKKRNIMRR